MASRAPLPGSSLSGSTLVTTVNARLATLFDASVLPLTSVSGADTVTATLDPATTAGLVEGMKFGLTWVGDNTGAVTLNINSGGAVDVLNADGSALIAGALTSGLRSMVEYHSSAFYLLTPTVDAAADAGRLITLSSSTTWTVPTDLSVNTLILVRAWGGGGGGHDTWGAGGGGGYAETWLLLDDLGASVTVTIGAGGVAGASATAGGNTTFGALLTAYGGGPGAAGGAGGGGGGTGAAGTSGAGSGGWFGGGNGASNIDGALSPPSNATGLWGGGGGGSAHDGAHAVFGGGGGGAGTGTIGGTSKFGGAGGNHNVAGTAPGGGGGRNAPGAAGRIEILIPR